MFGAANQIAVMPSRPHRKNVAGSYADAISVFFEQINPTKATESKHDYANPVAA